MGCAPIGLRRKRAVPALCWVRRSPPRTLRPRVIGSATHPTADPLVDVPDGRVVGADTLGGESVAFRDKVRSSQEDAMSVKVKDISTEQSVVREESSSQTSTGPSIDQSSVKLLIEDPTAAPKPPKRWVHKRSTDEAMPSAAPKKSRASIKFESHFKKVGFDESSR